jgi:hypothetical protein
MSSYGVIGRAWILLVENGQLLATEPDFEVRCVRDWHALATRSIGT